MINSRDQLLKYVWIKTKRKKWCSPLTVSLFSFNDCFWFKLMIKGLVFSYWINTAIIISSNKNSNFFFLFHKLLSKRWRFCGYFFTLLTHWTHIYLIVSISRPPFFHTAKSTKNTFCALQRWDRLDILKQSGTNFISIFFHWNQWL